MSDILFLLLTLATVLALVALVVLLDRRPLDEPVHDDGAGSSSAVGPALGQVAVLLAALALAWSRWATTWRGCSPASGTRGPSARLPPVGSTPTATSAGASTRASCSPSRWSACWWSTGCSGCSSGCHWTPAWVRSDRRLAWNTAVSFVTNTNWQGYAGESTMGHLAQMAGLAVQNFVSAAVGIAVAIALVRGFARAAHRPARQLLGRPGPRHLRILLPHLGGRRAGPGAGGVVQNFSAGTGATTLAGGTQSITGGPVASQEAIKELGTNGGGFYNANASHPFENPTALDQPARDLPAAS